MNNVYLYDGSFKHLLRTVDVLITKSIKPYDIVVEKDYVRDLFSKPYKVRMGNVCLDSRIKNLCFSIFLADYKGKELVIYYLLLNYRKYGIKVLNFRYLNCVNLALKLRKNVLHEAHKMKGFLRFRQLESGFLFATFAPSNNVIYYLASHFERRFKKENWIIYDELRHLALIYYEGRSYFINCSLDDINKTFSAVEKDVSDLWKVFFKTISIKERENAICQMRFMPKKYWKNIIEMGDCK